MGELDEAQLEGAGWGDDLDLGLGGTVSVVSFPDIHRSLHFVNLAPACVEGDTFVSLGSGLCKFDWARWVLGRVASVWSGAGGLSIHVLLLMSSGAVLCRCA